MAVASGFVITSSKSLWRWTDQSSIWLKDKTVKLWQGTSTEPEAPEGFATLLSQANSKLGWNSSSQSLYRVATQKCPNMLLTASWRVYSTNLRHTVYFYNSSVTPTDFGYCCSIYPYLDFDINNGSNAWHYVTADGSEDAKFTSKLPPEITFACSDAEFLRIPKGQFLNGVNNGLYLTIDSEVFESSYDDEFSLSTGSLMTLSYPFTRPIVKQRGLCKSFLTSG